MELLIGWHHTPDQTADERSSAVHFRFQVIQHPSNVLELRMQKWGFHAEAGQYIYLNCPAISHIQWHPFTLTSVSTTQSQHANNMAAYFTLFIIYNITGVTVAAFLKIETRDFFMSSVLC